MRVCVCVHHSACVCVCLCVRARMYLQSSAELKEDQRAADQSTHAHVMKMYTNTYSYVLPELLIIMQLSYTYQHFYIVSVKIRFLLQWLCFHYTLMSQVSNVWTECKWIDG